jgi:hypothetical protein
MAKGKIESGMSAILKLTDQLETQLPTLLSEQWQSSPHCGH